MKFEDNLKNLEKNIAELESPDLSLSRGIAVFEEGIANAKLCMDSLSESKGKITKLNEELDRLFEEPFLEDDE